MPFHLTNTQLRIYLDKGTVGEKSMARAVLDYKAHRTAQGRANAMKIFLSLPKATRDKIERMEGINRNY